MQRKNRVRQPFGGVWPCFLSYGMLGHHTNALAVSLGVSASCRQQTESSIVGRLQTYHFSKVNLSYNSLSALSTPSCRLPEFFLFLHKDLCVLHIFYWHLPYEVVQFYCLFYAPCDLYEKRLLCFQQSKFWKDDVFWKSDFFLCSLFSLYCSHF